MGNTNMSFTVGLDDKKYKSGVNSIVAETNKIKNTVEKTNKTLKNAADCSDKVVSSFKKIIQKFGPLAAAAGVAGGAFGTFNKYIRATQTTSDALDANMRAVTTTVDAFFISLNTGNVTNFIDNLGLIISRAKETNAVIDSLGNAMISYDLLSGEAKANFDEQINIYRDPNSSKEEKTAALKHAQEYYDKQVDYSETLAKKSLDAAIHKIIEKNPFLKKEDVTYDKMHYVFELDDTTAGENNKKRLETIYNNIENKKNNITKNEDMYTVKTEYDSRGMATTKNVLDKKKYKEEIEKMRKSFSPDEILALIEHEMLVNNTDEWLKGVKEDMARVNSSKMATTAMERTLNRVKGQEARANTSTTPDKTPDTTLDKTPDTTPIEVAPEGSIQKLIEARDALVKAYYMAATEVERANIAPKIKEANENIANAMKPLNGDNDKTEESIPEGAPEGSLAALQEEISKKQIELEYAIDDESRQKVYDELQELLEKEYNIRMSFTSEDGKTPIQKEVEGMVAGISQTIGQGDFSTEEGRKAVGRNVIDSIKAIIIAKAIEGAMNLPFPASIIAAPLAATAVAGLFSLIPKFATGGIIQGPVSSGDMNLARVNAGEMILNTSQQGRLFRMLNDGGAYNRMNAPVEREWRIEGSTLVGVLKNYNSIQSKMGKKIF